jgi:hypothetical protein
MHARFLPIGIVVLVASACGGGSPSSSGGGGSGGTGGGDAGGHAGTAGGGSGGGGAAGQAPPDSGAAPDGGDTCATGRAGPDCTCDVGTLEDESGACAPACDVVDCGAHGTCTALATGAADCRCDAGYAGDLCDTCAGGYISQGDGCIVDPCASLSCPQNAHCEATSQSVACVCDAGYEGADCDSCADQYSPSAEDAAVCLFDACLGVDCAAGTCAPGEAGGTVCVCPAGYKPGCIECATGYTSRDGGCFLDNPVTSGLIMWLDADAQGSLTMYSGSSVNLWANIATEPPSLGFSSFGAGDELPTRAEITVDGTPRHVVRFDGENDSLKGVLSLEDLGQYTVAFMANPSETAGSQAVVYCTNAAETGLALRFTSMMNATQYRFAHLTPIGTSSPSGSWYITAQGWDEPDLQYVMGRYRYGAVSYLAIDGPGIVASVQNSADPFEVNPVCYLGGTGATAAPRFKGDLGEFLVYDRSLTDNEATNLRRYLQAKWVGGEVL